MQRLTLLRGFIVFAHVLLINCERISFANHHVYELLPRNAEDLKALKTFEQNSKVLLLDALNVGWKGIAIVAPDFVSEFGQTLQLANVTYNLIEANAQRALETDIEPVADSNRRSSDYTWTMYHELNDTYNWMHNLAKQYSDKVSVFVVGETYEKRQILGIKISNGVEKPGIFLEGGMHAREWISPATTTYIANKLLTSKRRDTQFLLENYDFYIVPHCNPDGFVYTHTTNRLWRKTRSNQGRGCFGTDPNRNFEFHWNEVGGASSNPCSETFAGPSAFSEKETNSLAKFLNTLKNQLFLYVSFHSYSQLLLYPYGHTSELPSNNDKLKRVFDAAVAGIRRRYGTRYTGGNVHDAIYPATGSSIDWVYGVLNVNYSFCYELRPSSWSSWTGFRLPAAQIMPTGEETFDSLTEMIKTAQSLKSS